MIDLIGLRIEYIIYILNLSPHPGHNKAAALELDLGTTKSPNRAIALFYEFLKEMRGIKIQTFLINHVL